VELLAKFDPIMMEHVRKAMTQEIRDHYLSSLSRTSCSALWQIPQRKKIIRWCQKVKYYSIISDCTRDISRVEQMTTTIQFILIENRKVEIHEHFIGFSVAETSTGSGLTEHIN